MNSSDSTLDRTPSVLTFDWLNHNAIVIHLNTPTGECKHYAAKDQLQYLCCLGTHLFDQRAARELY